MVREHLGWQEALHDLDGGREMLADPMWRGDAQAARHCESEIVER